MDHPVVFTIIDPDAFVFRLISELATIREQDVARADEQGNRREISDASINRAHEITFRIDVARVNHATIAQTFDSEEGINLIKLNNLRIRKRRIEPGRQQDEPAGLDQTILAQSLREGQTDPATRRVTHDRYVCTTGDCGKLV